MLHTISTDNQSIIDPQLICAQDAVLFWQNGVFVALQNTPVLNAILEKTQHCYILDNDITARGLDPFIDKRLHIINLQQMVELTVQYFPQMNWQ